MEHNKSIDNFLKDLSILNIELKDDQIRTFIKYYEILVEWNGFMNLTAITDMEDVFKKHFIDSLSLIKWNGFKGDNIRLIDVGTGAGFPGIPLKIAFPSLEITLMDSLGKRVKFLKEVIDSCGLTGIEAIHSRAEDLARKEGYRDSFDLCVSRAVASLGLLSEYCLPFVKKGGYFTPYKSEKLQEELTGCEKGLKILRGQIIDQVDFMLPGTDIKRSILIIEKTEETPKAYPRKAGTAAKEPLW